MTREEAIRELKADYCGNRIVCELHPGQCNREDCEIWLAITALQAQDVDTISRKAVMWMLTNLSYTQCKTQGEADVIDTAKTMVNVMPSVQSVQPEQMPESYLKAVWTWLLDYQIKAAELKGKYTPYEVLSWVANDWRKEHE